MLGRALAIAAAAAVICGCQRSVDDGQDVQDIEYVKINAWRSVKGAHVNGEVQTDGWQPQTRAASAAPEMTDFPNHDDPEPFRSYDNPVSLFGFFLQVKEGGVHTPEETGTDNCGYMGSTIGEIKANAEKNDTPQVAANILQQDVDETSPNAAYTQFINNSRYVYSKTADAYISNDLAAFWRPDAYHYFICYAPPLDVSVDDALTLTLETDSHGVQGEPDYNFVYGRRVLQYNASLRKDSHHRTDGIDIYLAPQLSQLAVHLECDGRLNGSAVMFGLRVTTYKNAQFYLGTGKWDFQSSDTETITRYFDNDFVIMTKEQIAADEAKPEAERRNKPFTLSLFPNLENPKDGVITHDPPQEGDTKDVIKKLEICVNNTWVEVTGTAEMREDPDHPGTFNKQGSVIPLVPGYVTDVYLTVKPGKNIDEWNKLVITFSNWKHDTTFEYEGVFE